MKYEWIKLSARRKEPVFVPFSAPHPLAFHVLTQSPPGLQGERDALDMVYGGFALAPLSVRGSDRSGMIRPVDKIAGDDRYVFLSPFSPVDSILYPGSLISDGLPAFAFDVRMLAAASGFLFRLRDAADFYAWAVPGDDVEEDEVEGADLVDFGRMSEEEARRTWEELRASSVANDLRCLAEVLTIEDPMQALQAVLVLAQSASGALSEDEVQDISEDLIPETEVDPHACPVAHTVLSEGLAEGGCILDQWRDLFRSDRSIKGLMSIRPQPEILYRGALPLCHASFFRNAKGEWMRLPRDLCEAGKRKWGGY